MHAGAPRVSAELPETGERFQGLLPPVVAAATFAIRKPAVAVFTLDDYVAAGIMSAGQAEALRHGVATRANILVAGGTSTGKMTPTNALLAEVAKTSDREVYIQYVREFKRRADLVSTPPEGRRRLAFRPGTAHRCACAPIAFRSAKCAAPKR